MAHGDAWEGKWRGNRRLEWLSSMPRKSAEHSLSGPVKMLPADPHTSAVSSRPNCRPAESYGLVRFAEKRNLVSARVPSKLNCILSAWCCYCVRHCHRYLWRDMEMFETVLYYVCMSARDENDWIRIAKYFRVRKIFRTALELLTESILGWRSLMRADLNFSVTRTSSQRCPWLWRMQTIVSYQQKLQPAVRRVVLMCLKFDIWKITGEQ
jgi:hypothetical protein